MLAHQVLVPGSVFSGVLPALTSADSAPATRQPRALVGFCPANLRASGAQYKLVAAGRWPALAQGGTKQAAAAATAAAAAQERKGSRVDHAGRREEAELMHTLAARGRAVGLELRAALRSAQVNPVHSEAGKNLSSNSGICTPVTLILHCTRERYLQGAQNDPSAHRAAGQHYVDGADDWVNVTESSSRGGGDREEEDTQPASNSLLRIPVIGCIESRTEQFSR